MKCKSHHDDSRIYVKVWGPWIGDLIIPVQCVGSGLESDEILLYAQVIEDEVRDSDQVERGVKGV